jgi:hypothetical protein
LRACRPIFGYGATVLDETMVIADGPRAGALREMAGMGELPYPNGGTRPGLAETQQPIRLGQAYREYGILGMPYWAVPEPELGMMIYVEAPEHINAAPIDPRRIDLLQQMAGVPIPREPAYRWYVHMWGWLFPILFLAWLIVWRREDRAREEEHWTGDD